MYTTADAAWSKLSGGNLAGKADGRLLGHCKHLQANNSESVSPSVPGMSARRNNLNNILGLRPSIEWHGALTHVLACCSNAVGHFCVIMLRHVKALLWDGHRFLV